MENGFDTWDKGTADCSAVIAYCPYCGALNHIQGCYVVGDTTGIIHCEYCGAEL